MSKAICNVCNTRRVVENGLCTPCQTEGEWENEHSDRDHDGIQARFDAIMRGEDAEALTSDELYEIDIMKTCWVCHPELNKAQAEPKKGHTDTLAKTYTSHANCNHACTPADRAKCRKARRAAK